MLVCIFPCIIIVIYKTDYTISGDDSHVQCSTSCVTGNHPGGGGDNTKWCYTATSWGNCVGDAGMLS